MLEPGRVFMLGIYGTKATKDAVGLLKSTNASSVLLLGRNIESPAQTKALTEELVQRVGRPILFAVDHEGGWVLRFKAGVTAFPGNAALGRIGSAELAQASGEHMARELLAMGIQLNLAPVVDVLTDRYNPGIGIRSFGKDPALVAELGAAMIKGMQEHGVSACAKHFPGKGAATVDAHVELPTIRIPRPEFARTHLAPFKAAVKAGVDCVMTSHVRYPALDRKIATFSRRITKDILRRRLGFAGVVISDDLCMGAVTGAMPVQMAAVEAIQAGHDMLIIAHDRQAMAESAELLSAAVSDGLIERRAVEESARRIERLLHRKRRAPKPDPQEASDLAEAIAFRSVEVVRQGAVKLPLQDEAGRALLVFPDFSEAKERFTFEQGPRGPERWLRAGLPARRVALAPIESADVSRLRRDIHTAEKIVFFCFEAMRFPGQRATLELLNKEAAKKTVLCLIRNSWDESLAHRDMTILDCRGYRNRQLAAALSCVFHLGDRNGKMLS